MTAAPVLPDTIFYEAIAIPDEDDRMAYLDRACGTNANLRREAERLVRDHFLAGRFLEEPAIAVDVTTQHPSVYVGMHIGPYKLLEQIGEGGMGIVFVAEQTEPIRRRVALKVIKPGMDTKQVIARFEAERQALAMMDHPNIARVLDAGTTAGGRPYFVMELVRGLPITDYCDKARLSPQQRLDLFITVCQAVQHAHQKGIIHRDLKPSNVMVTMHDGRPLAKVIDFGVAKAIGQQLTDLTIYTAHAQLVGTPLYMSPEQAELSSHDVDTRSDVYSLGVLLYELLTSQTPFDKDTLNNAGFDEMRRIIREDEPPRPSHRVSTLGAQVVSTISQHRGIDERELNRVLRGELDWIVMKALAKAPSERYESPSAFARDIERYLTDEPVQACPPSSLYHFRKFARKHQTAITTTALIAASLFLCTLVSTWQAIHATQARARAAANETEAKQAAIAEATQRQRAEEGERRAQRSFKLALDTVDRLMSHLSRKELREVPLVQPIRAKILHDTITLYKRLIAESNNSASIRLKVLDVWCHLGEVLSGDLGNREEGRKAFDAALMIARELHAEEPNRLEYREALARVLMQNAYFYSWALGRNEESAALFLEVKEHQTALQRDFPNRQSYIVEGANADTGLGGALSELGHDEDGTIALRRSIEVLERCDKAAIFTLASSWLALAERLKTREPAEADSAFRRAIGDFRTYLADHPPGEQTDSFRFQRSQFARALIVGARHITVRDPSEGEAWLRECWPIIARLRDDFPTNPNCAESLRDCSEQLVVLLDKSGRDKEALTLLVEYLGRWPEQSNLHSLLAKHLTKQPTPEALAALTERVEEFPDIESYYVSRAAILRTLRRYEEAIKDYSRSIKLKPGGDFLRYQNRGELHVLNKQYKAAVEDFTVIIDEWTKVGGGTRYIYKRRGWANFYAGQFDEALADITKAVEGGDITTLTWIPLDKIAACPSETFRQQFLKLVDRAVERHPNAHAARAVFLVTIGDVSRAADDFRNVLTNPTTTYYPRYQAAMLAIKLDDLVTYKAACAGMLAKFADSMQPLEAHFAAWTCALTPHALDNYEPALVLARRAMETARTDPQFINGAGALLLRAGRFTEAAETLAAAAAAAQNEKSSPAYTSYLLAITHYHLAKPNDARKWLQQANDQADKELNDPENPVLWNRRLTFELFRREASELIESSATPEGKPEANDQQ